MIEIKIDGAKYRSRYHRSNDELVVSELRRAAAILYRFTAEIMGIADADEIMDSAKQEYVQVMETTENAES